MNRNSNEIFTRAAHSNLTATAEEFVPRSGPSISSNMFSDHPGSSYSRDNNRNDEYGNRSVYPQKKKRDENENRSYFNNRFKYSRPANNNNFSFNNNRNSAPRLVHKERRPEINDSRYEIHDCNQGISANYNNDYNSSAYFVNDNHRNRNTTRTLNGQIETNSYEQNGRYPAPSSSFGNRYEKLNNVTYNTDKLRNNSNSCKPDEKNKRTLVSNEAVCQRDRLIEQLNDGVLECLVCCERVKQINSVWSCSSCYHVLHLSCVIKWAKSSKNENGKWRCPACQFESEHIPEKYTCFCGKTKLQSDWNRNDTAHSCGEVCGKSKENPTPWFICEHRCNLLCHPGPCPPCTIQITRECGCSRTKSTVQCSTKMEIRCGAICDNLLNCGVHRCLRTCHFGDCGTCNAKIAIDCYCGQGKKEIICGSEDISLAKFSCGKNCGRLLACGNHKCESVCHESECGLCPRSPIVQNTCCCAKTVLQDDTRTSCLDPIPTCGQVCGKVLPCGPVNKQHTCESLCHENECEPCTKETFVKCRCGIKEKSILCTQVNAANEFKCQKKCAKKRSCGKHKCNHTCCIDTEHICPQRCNGTLNCGKHRCELLCHRGKCGRCLQSSFDELYCHCGHSVIYPPVPCGTKPPSCDQPCKRTHDCEHPPLHTCHSDRTCTPCIVFTDKLCYGGHELRKTIPCYQKEFSCGLPCGRSLPCGFHKCQTSCHAGECIIDSKKCTQPCTKSRDLCGHPCAAPCHETLCPDTVCREMIKVTCACGNLTANHPCYEHTDDFKRIISRTLAAKMAEMQLDNSVSIWDMSEKMNDQKINLRTLECSNECRLIMRNRRLALALQIQNPDLSAKLTPKYSDFMKMWVKKDSTFCRNVHDKLTTLVKLAKESKQKSRSFSFEIMNREKRQFVHEYCAHFGCESEAYDAEPKRNVVAIAVKGKCWLPAMSVIEAVQREMGQRKVPIPVFMKKTSSKNENIAANSNPPTAIILPLLPSASTSQSAINYFGD